MNDVNTKLIETYVKTKLEHNNNGHDFYHALRVVANIKQIATDVDCDLNICIIAGYVHDLIDYKVAEDVETATSELCEFLKSELKLDQHQVALILDICQTISYSKGLKLSSTEAKVVQDGDRLDALGAIGITRTLQYSFATSRPIYITGDKSDSSAIGHFHSKLYKLYDLLNFKVSQELARPRLEIMKQFEQQYISENSDLD